MLLGVGLIALAMTNMWTRPSEPPARAEVVQRVARITSPLGPERPADLPAPVEVSYPAYPSKGDEMGVLSIPALKQEFPVYEGTGDRELEKGVGHFAKSVLPGENDNCVLSGHRDTVFRKLGKLKKGDSLVVRTAAGTFTYEISGIRIVDKDDRTVIVPTDHAVLTVSTCYPFRYVGNAPKRYVLSADLVAPETAALDSGDRLQ